MKAAGCVASTDEDEGAFSRGSEEPDPEPLSEVVIRVICLDPDGQAHHAMIQVMTPQRHVQSQIAAATDALRLWGQRMNHQVLSAQVEVTRTEEMYEPQRPVRLQVLQGAGKGTLARRTLRLVSLVLFALFGANAIIPDAPLHSGRLVASRGADSDERSRRVIVGPRLA